MAVQSIVTGVQLSTHKPWNVNEREKLKDRDIQAEKINHKGRTDVTETDFVLLGFGSSDESASESRRIKYHITDFTTPTKICAHVKKLQKYDYLHTVSD